MKTYSNHTTYLFVTSIAKLMHAIRSSSEDGKFKEPKKSPEVNQRFKGLLNEISDSLHNIHYLYDGKQNREQQLFSINYHINMVTHSIASLVKLEQHADDLMLPQYQISLHNLLDALNEMKNETSKSVNATP